MSPTEPSWYAYAEATGAVLLLLLGAFVGFSLTGLQAYLDRERRRKSLASALLIELRVLEHAISLRYDDPLVGESRGSLVSTVFERFSSDLLLLEHERLHPVLDFYSFVTDVSEHLKNARERLAKGEQLSDADHQRIRLKAQFALQRIADAKRALEASGGVLPDCLPNAGKQFRELPPAPPRSFPPPPDDTFQ